MAKEQKAPRFGFVRINGTWRPTGELDGDAGVARFVASVKEDAEETQDQAIKTDAYAIVDLGEFRVTRWFYTRTIQASNTWGPWGEKGRQGN